MQGAGVEVKAVTIPELEYLRVAHTVTIVSEMHHNFQVCRQHSSAWSYLAPANDSAQGGALSLCALTSCGMHCLLLLLDQQDNPHAADERPSACGFDAIHSAYVMMYSTYSTCV
jgi:hypothetical protein